MSSFVAGRLQNPNRQCTSRKHAQTRNKKFEFAKPNYDEKNKRNRVRVRSLRFTSLLCLRMTQDVLKLNYGT